MALAIVVIAASISSCNRKQQPDFKGLFDFKVNETMVKDLDTTKYKMVEVSKQTDVLDVIKNENVHAVHDWEVMVDGVRKFKLMDMQNSEAMLPHFELLFYNDKLYDISTNVYGPMESALTAKYPNYEEQIDQGTGAITYLWYNGPITAMFKSENGEARMTIYDGETTIRINELADKAQQEFIKSNTSI